MEQVKNHRSHHSFTILEHAKEMQCCVVSPRSRPRRSPSPGPFHSWRFQELLGVARPLGAFDVMLPRRYLECLSQGVEI